MHSPEQKSKRTWVEFRDLCIGYASLAAVIAIVEMHALRQLDVYLSEPPPAQPIPQLPVPPPPPEPVPPPPEIKGEEIDIKKPDFPARVPPIPGTHTQDSFQGPNGSENEPVEKPAMHVAPQMDETARLNLQELAKHATKIGTEVIDGVTYDILRGNETGDIYRFPSLTV